MSNGKTLIIIPTFNEAGNIAELHARIRKYSLDSDILFVDDGSIDGTREIIDGIVQADAKAHILRRRKKEGIARAYICGFLWGLERDYSWFQQMDADLSHDPAYLVEIEKLKKVSQAIVASRYLNKAGADRRSFFRKMITFLGCRYLKFVLRCPLKDLTGGFNCWPREVMLGLGLDKIVSRGFIFQAELKLMAYKKGFKIIEFPYVFRERQKGRSKIDQRIIFEGLILPILMRSRSS